MPKATNIGQDAYSGTKEMIMIGGKNRNKERFFHVPVKSYANELHSEVHDPSLKFTQKCYKEHKRVEALHCVV